MLAEGVQRQLQSRAPGEHIRIGQDIRLQPGGCGGQLLRRQAHLQHRRVPSPDTSSVTRCAELQVEQNRHAVVVGVDLETGKLIERCEQQSAEAAKTSSSTGIDDCAAGAAAERSAAVGGAGRPAVGVEDHSADLLAPAAAGQRAPSRVTGQRRVRMLTDRVSEQPPPAQVLIRFLCLPQL